MQLRRIFLSLLVLPFVLALGACQQKEGPAEKAGKELDKAAESIGKQIESIGDGIQGSVSGK